MTIQSFIGEVLPSPTVSHFQIPSSKFQVPRSAALEPGIWSLELGTSVPFRSKLEFRPAGVSPLRVLRTIRRAEYAELIALFFLQGAALGMWFVPLSNVLDAHGLHDIKPFAFAASGVAAFISPLIFGAMADRHASPVKVLRGLAVATAFPMTLASTAIKLRWNPWLVLALV